MFLEKAGESPATPEAGTGESSDTGSTYRTAVKMTAVLTAAGIAGRVALQHIPSVETVLPMAVAAGFFYGSRYGFASGAAGFFATNFLVWGGQGPWTVFQVLGAGAAGASGGLMGVLSERPEAFFASLVAGTLIFETAVNLGSLAYTPWAAASPLTYLAAALPFAGIHIASSIGFGSIIYGIDGKLESIVG
ncbi:MAG: hypothetical protein ABEI58_03825 [Candidatus Nanohaloarchaea archaeon]